MKMIVKKKVLYQCGVCKAKYSSIFKARKCEKRSLEVKKFKVGDPVKNLEKRFCPSLAHGTRYYTFEGKVIRILGPFCPDEKYELKWFPEKPERLNGHVWMYEIEYICPACHKRKTACYYTPELEKI